MAGVWSSRKALPISLCATHMAGFLVFVKRRFYCILQVKTKILMNKAQLFFEIPWSHIKKSLMNGTSPAPHRGACFYSHTHTQTPTHRRTHTHHLHTRNYDTRRLNEKCLQNLWFIMNLQTFDWYVVQHIARRSDVGTSGT